MNWTRAQQARFWSHVDMRGEDECWPWLGWLNESGYGRLNIGTSRRMVVYAHRFSWLTRRGPIPDGACVLHSCDNPQCCNPAHLRIGTRAENAADRVARKRAPRGSGASWSLLTEDLVLKARARHAAGEPVASIARDMSVKYYTLTSAVSGKTWGWL